MAYTTYHRNLCGMKLTSEQNENIPAPRLELATHVTLKSSQLLGLLGGGVIAPVTAIIKGQNDWNSMQDRSFRYGKNGIIAGLVLGPLITSAFVPGKSFDSLVDRCYRIRVNKGQLRADRCSILGMMVGVGAAHFMSDTLERGAVFGFISGFFIGTALNFMS